VVVNRKEKGTSFFVFHAAGSKYNIFPIHSNSGVRISNQVNTRSIIWAQKLTKYRPTAIERDTRNNKKSLLPDYKEPKKNLNCHTPSEKKNKVAT
jgi:hypothetical protein